MLTGILQSVKVFLKKFGMSKKARIWRYRELKDVDGYMAVLLWYDYVNKYRAAKKCFAAPISIICEDAYRKKS